MVKNISMTYGSFNLPNNLVFTSILVELLDASEVAVQTVSLTPGEASASMEVPVGNGWSVKVTNLDQNTDAISHSVLSSVFDVVGETPTNIVVAVNVS